MKDVLPSTGYLLQFLISNFLQFIPPKRSYQKNAGNVMGLQRGSPVALCPVDSYWPQRVVHLHFQSSPATTVTSPSSTPAKTIDTSPPVDLFATPSAAVPVRLVKEYSLNVWFLFFICTEPKLFQKVKANPNMYYSGLFWGTQSKFFYTWRSYLGLYLSKHSKDLSCGNHLAAPHLGKEVEKSCAHCRLFWNWLMWKMFSKSSFSLWEI